MKQVVSVCAEQKVDLLHVYIIEAHPKEDGWPMPVNGVLYEQPKVLQDRLAIANTMAEDLDMKNNMVVDDITNPCDLAYEARPDRLYVLDDNKIVWRSGVGPCQYDVDAMKSFLTSKLEDK